MVDEATYEVVLAPEGVPLEEAIDTVTFTFETDEEDDLRSAAVDYVFDEGIVDASSWKYWEVATITEAVDDPVDGLREAMVNNPATANNQCRLGESPMTLHVLVDGVKWEKTTIIVPNVLRKRFGKWANDLAKQNPTVKSKRKQELHEAVVRAVAKADGGTHTSTAELIRLFQANDPDAGEDLIRCALSLEDDILDELKQL